ncbi:amidase [Paraburkholderia humisilvae]|uniref:Amidase AmiD n=1 Tax=Paraburkholderia humisilvae TaxID=627669 RepID=A0A6J5DEM7_9BURK|nr:amidase [Paraburkholderia humisilvae]CAB3751867.1 Putative amidase AmiD [Paraburkholderia humisilvae]
MKLDNQPWATTLIASRGDAQACASRLAQARARADERDPQLKAFTFRPDHYDGVDHAASKPLAGMPIAVKDLIATADMPTTYGSPVYAGHLPAEDAAIVARIREFGGIVFGKTVTTEFAWRQPGPTVNPWNPLHTPGGSSSGSAAAVGAGIVPLAVGTQTLGSVIRPAAYCGVVGYKPTHGRVPTTGAHPLSQSLDHIGFFANRVDDVALAHALFVDGNPDALASVDAWQAAFTPRRPISVGIIRTSLWSRADDEQKANFEASIERLHAAGVQPFEFELHVDLPVIVDALHTILQVEAHRNIGPVAATHPDKVSDRMKALVEAGAAVPAAKYDEARTLQKELSAQSAAFVGGCDVLVSPPATGGAPRGLDDTGDATFCVPWSFLGMPAVTIPSGRTANGLPLGLQLIGARDADRSVLEFAAWAQAVLPAFG